MGQGIEHQAHDLRSEGLTSDGTDTIVLDEAGRGEVTVDCVDPLIGQSAELRKLIGGDGFPDGIVVDVAVVDVVEDVVRVHVVDVVRRQFAAEDA